MTKKTAIKVLAAQLEKLRDIKNETKVADRVLYGPNWFIQTKSHLIEIFGADSQELVGFANYRPPNDASFQHSAYFMRYGELQKDIQVFMENCIQTIKTRGVSPKAKINFLQKYDSPQVFKYSLLILGSTLVLGIWLGNQFPDLAQYIPRLIDRIKGS